MGVEGVLSEVELLGDEDLPDEASELTDEEREGDEMDGDGTSDVTGLTPR